MTPPSSSSLSLSLTREVPPELWLMIFEYIEDNATLSYISESPIYPGEIAREVLCRHVREIEELYIQEMHFLTPTEPGKSSAYPLGLSILCRLAEIPMWMKCKYLDYWKSLILDYISNSPFHLHHHHPNNNSKYETIYQYIDSLTPYSFRMHTTWEARWLADTFTFLRMAYYYLSYDDDQTRSNGLAVEGSGTIPSKDNAAA